MACNAKINKECESPVDLVYETMAAHVQDTVNRAFEEYPLDDSPSSIHRWTLICSALDKAEKAVGAFVNLNPEDQTAIDTEGFAAIDANTDSDKEATSQRIGAIMFVYRAAIDRADGL